jgi:histidinol-phosphate aminotransferase
MKNNKSSKFVAKLQPYKVTYQECWDLYKDYQVIKLDWNESTIPPSLKVKKRLIEFIENDPLNWYPDADARDLRIELSKYTSTPAEYIQVFNGSDAALEYIARAFIDPGDEVIIRQPTYDNFRVYAQSCGAEVKNVICSTPFKIEEDKIISAISRKTKIIYLVNPDNPTGIIYTKSQIKNILEKAPNAIVIVDEAYFEFYGKSAISLIKKYPNLIVSRSFSKAFSLAGLRCGYIISQPENIDIINKIRVGKNVNSLAQIAAIFALKDKKHMENYVKLIQKTKIETIKSLKKLGFKIHDSKANFILIKINSVNAFLEFSRENHIFLRDRSSMPGLNNFIRITIGTPKEMKIVIDMIKKFKEMETEITITENEL